MKRIQTMLGYIIASISIFMAIGAWTSNGNVGKAIVQRWNLEVSPNLSGGKIIKKIERVNYQIVIHEPVFIGLRKLPKKGFIQIDVLWETSSPIMIQEEIDFDGDKAVDFRFSYNTQSDHVRIDSYNATITTTFNSYKRKSGYTLRINIKNPDFAKSLFHSKEASVALNAINLYSYEYFTHRR